MRQVMTVAMALLGVAARPAGGGEAPRAMRPGETWLTIYGSFGLVRQCRTVTLQKGATDCHLAGIAAEFDADSVRLLDQTDPSGTRVLEHHFLRAPATPAELLRHSVGRHIELIDSRGKNRTGTLLAFETRESRAANVPDTLSITLRARDGSVEVIRHSLADPHILRFPDLPQDLPTHPTLRCTLDAAKPGDHSLVVSYLTEGLSWENTYTAVLSADESRLDLSGCVSIRNETGARFPAARIRLVAGDVSRARHRVATVYGEDYEASLKGRALFEYHLYALPRPVTLEAGQAKQVEFIKVTGIPVRKAYTYDGAPVGLDPKDHAGEPYGAEGRRWVWARIELENTREANLGIPLPGGNVLLYKQGEHAPEFIGEDFVDDTPRGETVTVHAGVAFDIVGERVQRDYTRPRDNQIRETFAIELRNRKDAAVTVLVQEALYRGVDWTIERSSVPFKKLHARRIEFALPVPANGKANLTYTVVYTWPIPVIEIQRAMEGRAREER